MDFKVIAIIGGAVAGGLVLMSLGKPGVSQPVGAGGGGSKKEAGTITTTETITQPGEGIISGEGYTIILPPPAEITFPDLTNFLDSGSFDLGTTKKSSREKYIKSHPRKAKSLHILPEPAQKVVTKKMTVFEEKMLPPQMQLLRKIGG